MRRIGRPIADAALGAALLDHYLLAPAMWEALAYRASLDARLQRQGLGRDTQFLVARSVVVGHSVVLISLPACGSAAPSHSCNRRVFVAMSSKSKQIGTSV